MSAVLFVIVAGPFLIFRTLKGRLAGIFANWIAIHATFLSVALLGAGFINAQKNPLPILEIDPIWAEYEKLIAPQAGKNYVSHEAFIFKNHEPQAFLISEKSYNRILDDLKKKKVSNFGPIIDEGSSYKQGIKRSITELDTTRKKLSYETNKELARLRLDVLRSLQADLKSFDPDSQITHKARFTGPDSLELWVGYCSTKSLKRYTLYNKEVNSLYQSSSIAYKPIDWLMYFTLIPYIELVADVLP